MSPTGLSRRRVLTAAALGATGVATAGAVRATDAAADGTVADPRTAFAAFAGTAPGRLGAHEVVWSVSAATGRVALTFDDGPTPEFTPRILAILADRGLRATFNVVGHNVMRHPALLHEVVAAGHEIGNHSYRHLNLATVDVATTHAELARTQDAIAQVVQRHVTVFRPPHGRMTGALLRAAAELGLTTVLWSVDRLVPGVGTPAAVRTAMTSTITGGDIVCLHDGLGHAGTRPHSAEAQLLRARRRVEVAALGDVLDSLAGRGLLVGSVGDLRAAAARTVPAPASGTAAPRG